MNITQFFLENSLRNIEGVKQKKWRVNIVVPRNNGTVGVRMYNCMDYSSKVKDYVDVQFYVQFVIDKYNGEVRFDRVGIREKYVTNHHTRRMMYNKIRAMIGADELEKRQ